MVGEAERQFRLLLDSTSEGIYGLDREGCATFVNRAALEMLGYDCAEQLLGKNMHSLMHYRRPDGRPYAHQDCPLLRCLTSCPGCRADDEVFWRRDGSSFRVDYSAHPIIEDGEQRGCVVTFSDITERHEAAARERAHSLVTQILADSATLQDAAPKVLQALCETLQWSAGLLWEPPAQGSGMKCTSFVAIDAALKNHECLVYCHRLGNCQGAAGQAWSKQQPVWVGDVCRQEAATCSAVPAAGVAGVFAFPIVAMGKAVAVLELLSSYPREINEFLTGMATDIGSQIGQFVERKTAQAKLKQRDDELHHSLKMEAVGRLAGGVAHDFNNLLCVISGYSAMAIAQLHPQDPLQDSLREIQCASERASALTRQLLTFSRREVVQPRVVSVNSVVEGLQKMLHRLVGEDIELTTRLDPHAGSILAEPAQLEQIIMNLVVNARDAMPDGGQLTISTAFADAESGAYVSLAVADTGCGMDADTQSHVFEPFFTTKEQGHGTGLGLSTVYGIVQASNGNILLESETGKGTTFTILLPKVSMPAECGDSLEASADLAGHESVLLVEDEASVRCIVRRTLQAQGYKVLDARNPQEAHFICEQFDQPWDLLITDVVMPGMNGRQFAESLIQRYPSMRVLFMSGYTDDKIMRHGILQSNLHFLPKPFHPSDLLRKVREVLAS